jgi:eukaryotic-like serine/threonine-protein kinase
LIGRYRVERELARGAMGIVYQAHDPAIGRKVAIKLVRADLLAGEDHEVYLARFRQEAQAAGRCMHPNIVSIYDFALHEGNPFLAMEYVDGVGLGEAMQRTGRFTPDAAVATILQVLDALGAAHALGVVHRDVKPANVLLMANGQVKVTDFGISRLDTSDMTLDGTVIGTPAYMSPEQCRGEAVDLRSDLFSTGTILYELLSGTRPFPGRSATEVSYLLLNEDPRDLAEIVPGVPDGLRSALRRAMEKQRDARFDSAQAMAGALRDAMRVAISADTAVSEDHTVVLRSVPAPAPITFDDVTLSTIERRLAEHIGPIARQLVRNAARQSNSVETLCEALASSITQPDERKKFLNGILRTPSLRTSTTTAQSGILRQPVTGSDIAADSGISAEQIERAERALMQHVGPIARLLVKRALPGARSDMELWDRLAAHVEPAADRDAFLRRRAN